ncbi:MAG: biosynthetic peptidoglycan transglycosylase, partial [Spirochaetota bacterium]
MIKKRKSFTFLILSFLILILSISFLFVFTSCSSDIAEMILTLSGKKDSVYFRVKNFENQIHQGGRGFTSPHSITIYDRNKIILAKLYDRDFEYVSIEQIPPYLVDLLLIKEDFTFFTHKGIVPRRILVSMLKNIKYKRNAFGGSTITQQVSKLLFTDQKKTIVRKIKEMITAFYLEKILTKEQILEIYLNIAFFGYGRYGIAKA